VAERARKPAGRAAIEQTERVFSHKEDQHPEPTTKSTKVTKKVRDQTWPVRALLGVLRDRCGAD